MTATACGLSAPTMACTPYASGEDLLARPSPYDSVEVALGLGRAKICYSRPLARGRVVFGDLVPWDTLWRTGANEPTILHLSQAARIAGLEVERGSYSIYTVPGEQQWQVVVNSSTTQWGQTRDVTLPNGGVSQNAYTGEVQAQEVGRRPIEFLEIEHVEQFTASFAQPSGVSTEIYFDWATTRIAVPIELIEAR